jgi:hypothetical protein
LKRGSIPPFEMICLIFFLSFFVSRATQKIHTGYHKTQ